MERLERVKPILVCPSCRCDLAFSDTAGACGDCGTEYPIRGGKIYFVEPPARSDDFDAMKSRMKALFGRYYYSIGVDVLAPIIPWNYAREVKRYLDPARALVIDAGSGNRRRHEDFICCDQFPYDEVDVVCDLHQLPFRDASVDGILSLYALEHVRDIGAVVAEIDRCTKEGGLGIHGFPFLYPYHASPEDYWRYTHQGFPELFPGWRVLRSVGISGPFVLAMGCFAEIFAICLSFGSAWLRPKLYLLACALTFPFKFFDLLFAGREIFLNVASTILVVLQKPTSPEPK